MKTGRTIVLTGAAGGMGAEFVKRFLDNGDNIGSASIYSGVKARPIMSPPRLARSACRAASRASSVPKASP
jgi:NAD(P)-dependent dehydrogenase (short-subunit alcohol dehydrogenase family)